jgi:hypothetical protein
LLILVANELVDKVLIEQRKRLGMNAPVSVCGRELNLAVAAVGRGQQTADTARGDRSWSALFSGSRRLAEDGTRQTGGIQGLANDGGTATRQHTGLRVLVPVGHMGWVLVGYGIWVGDFDMHRMIGKVYMSKGILLNGHLNLSKGHLIFCSPKMFT